MQPGADAAALVSAGLQQANAGLELEEQLAVLVLARSFKSAWWGVLWYGK